MTFVLAGRLSALSAVAALQRAYPTWGRQRPALLTVQAFAILWQGNWACVSALMWLKGQKEPMSTSSWALPGRRQISH